MCLNVVVLLGTLVGLIGAYSLENCPPILFSNLDIVRTFDTSCYEFEFKSQHNSWNDAEKHCEKKGGRLVVIQSAAEQEFLVNSLRELQFTGDEGLWIGLSDASHEGTWTWVGGAAVTYKNWADGQPGRFGALEDCAMLNFAAGGKWHDYRCDSFLFFKSKHAYICEYDMILPSTSDSNALTTPLPTGTPSQSSITTGTTQPATPFETMQPSKPHETLSPSTSSGTPFPSTSSGTPSPSPQSESPSPSTSSGTPSPSTLSGTPSPKTPSPSPSVPPGSFYPSTPSGTPSPSTPVETPAETVPPNAASATAATNTFSVSGTAPPRTVSGTQPSVTTLRSIITSTGGTPGTTPI
ncbi:hypothetical protein ScPMuIL_008652 [Solemya velum]